MIIILTFVVISIIINVNNANLNAADFALEASADFNPYPLIKTSCKHLVDIFSDPKYADAQIGSGLLTSIYGVPYVLTCAHVINCSGDRARLRVTLADGNTARFKRVRVSSYLDLAAIELDLPEGSSRLPDFMSALAEVVEGDELVFYACSGKERTPVKGVTRVVQTRVFDPNYPCHNMVKVCGSKIARGFSGGPVLNKANKLVGLVARMDSQNNSVGEIVPASEIVAFVRSFTESDSSWTPSLIGFYTHQDNQNVVKCVIAHTTAEDIGLQTGDAIVMVNGVQTEDYASILHETAWRSYAEISIVVIRGNEEIVLKAEIDASYADARATRKR